MTGTDGFRLSSRWRSTTQRTGRTPPLSISRMSAALSERSGSRREAVTGIGIIRYRTEVWTGDPSPPGFRKYPAGCIAGSRFPATVSPDRWESPRSHRKNGAESERWKSFTQESAIPAVSTDRFSRTGMSPAGWRRRSRCERADRHAIGPSSPDLRATPPDALCGISREPAYIRRHERSVDNGVAWDPARFSASVA